MLPARIALTDQEALDGFLERLAAINELPPPTLLNLASLIRDSNPIGATFLMIRPGNVTAQRLSDLSGIPSAALIDATLARYDGGLPLRLSGFDPDRRDSFRQVAAQGWFPPSGSQACPQCLAHDGIWRVRWRLPLVATCVEHRVFLVTQCAGCGGRFRTRQHSPLRPSLGPEEPCGNPVGLRNPCQHSVIAHHSEPADPAVIDTTSTILSATASQAVFILGGEADPRVFLAEVRHLATLLLHMVAHDSGPVALPWVDELRLEAVERTNGSRKPRWGVSPPCSAIVRGQVLYAAHQILRQPSIQDAAALLAPWLDLVSGQPGGPVDWLLNHTTRSPLMERLIRLASAQRGHVGRRLTAAVDSNSLCTQSIPQLIDEHIYAQIFAGMLDTLEWTGRLYVSLCITRTATTARSWSDAAASLSMQPALGARTAKAASARMCCSPKAFADAVVHAVRLLPRDRDFRQRESRVRALASGPASWFGTWCISMSPPRRPVALPYALTWMWCEVAQGFLDTSPAWPGGPTRQNKAAYRVFRDRLPASAQRDLRALVLTDSSHS